jgi:hypothetical protein
VQLCPYTHWLAYHVYALQVDARDLEQEQGLRQAQGGGGGGGVEAGGLLLLMLLLVACWPGQLLCRPLVQQVCTVILNLGWVKGRGDQQMPDRYMVEYNQITRHCRNTGLPIVVAKGLIL